MGKFLIINVIIMVQKPKLDLTNYRGEKPLRTPYVFDSSLMIDIDGDRKNSAVKFSTHFEKVPLRIPAQSTLDPIITPRGSLWEMKEIVERKDCVVKMHRRTADDRVVESWNGMVGGGCCWWSGGMAAAPNHVCAYRFRGYL